MSMQEGSNGEGNGGAKVKIIRIAGLLFIGMDGDIIKTLGKPRMIEFVTMKDGTQGVRFSEPPGGAEAMEYGSNVDFTYYPTDKGFINAYMEAVLFSESLFLPGARKMPRPNVVNMGKH